MGLRVMSEEMERVHQKIRFGEGSFGFDSFTLSVEDIVIVAGF
jgi:hypothetical protein